MKWDHIIRNGTIVGEDRVYPGDIYVKDGRIAAITCCPLEGEADQITDAAGKLIFPGFIETHAHSRDGYLSTGEKEDFASSTAAAAATGITTLLEMPNCTPPTYDAEKVRQLVEQITPKAHVDFGVWGLAAGKLNQAQLQAMADAGVTPEQVDYLNAHGTATPINDAFETNAVKLAFGEAAKGLHISSTKSMTGHLLGGAAAIEAVACVMAIRDGVVPPTIGYEQPDPECDLDVTPNQAVSMPVRVAISNSLGFGGHNACILFKKV